MKKRVFLFFTLLGSTLLSANIGQLNTFASDFKQIIVNDQNQKIVYKGKIYAKKKSNQALWIYTSPIDKKIYYTKGHVVIIEPELEQAIFAKLDKVPNILTLLKSAKKISENKLVTTFDKTTYTIHLANGNLAKITYKDELQNRVAIYFYNPHTNTAIDESRFTYHIPKDYDILEQR